MRRFVRWGAAALAVAGLTVAAAPVETQVIGGIRWSVMTVQGPEAVPGVGR